MGCCTRTTSRKEKTVWLEGTGVEGELVVTGTAGDPVGAFLRLEFVHEELTVGGKPVVMDATDASVQRNGKWLCALHTESVAGDPFGRDRTERNAITPSLADRIDRPR